MLFTIKKAINALAKKAPATGIFAAALLKLQFLQLKQQKYVLATSLVHAAATSEATVPILQFL